MNNVITMNQFSSVQLFSHVRLFETQWTAAFQASLCMTNSWSLLKLMSIELMMHLLITMNSLPFFLQITLLLNKVTWNSPSVNTYNQLGVKLGSFVLFHF